MRGQMTLFDLIESPDINDIPEEEAVRIIGDRLGIRFEKGKFGYYWARVGEVRLHIDGYRTYTGGKRAGQRFLGAGCVYKDGGASCPFNSIDEAVEWFKERRGK